MDSMRKGSWAVAALGLVAIFVVGAACGGDARDIKDSNDSSVRELKIGMSDELAFNPPAIEVSAGEPIRLIVENSGAALHDWSVAEIAVERVMSEGSETGGHSAHGEELDLHVALDGGQAGSIEFTPMEAGEYRFVCTVTGHAAAGMIGTLVVRVT